MADQTIKTGVEIEVKPKGFESAEQKAKRLSDQLSPEKLSGGLQRMDFFLGRVERQLGGMERSIKNLNQSLHRFGQATQQIDKFATAMERAARAATGMRAGGGGGGGGGGAPPRDPREGSFQQGFLQQMGFGPFLQRGPGMKTQAAGMMAGGIARAPFAGLGGLTQGLANIPGVGLMAGPMQAALAGASDYLQVQQLQLQMASRGGAVPSGVRGAANDAFEASWPARLEQIRQEGMKEKSKPKTSVLRTIANQALNPLSGATAIKEVAETAASELGSYADEFLGALDPRRTRGRDPKTARLTKRGNTAVSIAERNKEAFRHQALQDASQRNVHGMSLFGQGSLAELGEKRGGMSVLETMQFQDQLVGASGGIGQMSARATRAGVGAKTAFGIGPDISGQFLRASRQGGMITGETRSSEMLAETIASATSQGLEGSDLVEYMQEMAAGIQSFRETGIPINPRSLGDMATTVGRMGGLMPGRAGAIAGGFQRTAQGIAQAGGPKTALEFMMFRTAGGFNGGGMRGFNAAREKMRTGNFTGAEINSMIRGTIGASVLKNNPDAAHFGIQQLIQNMGGGLISLEDAEMIRRQLTGETLDEAQTKRLQDVVGRQKRAGEKTPKGAAGIAAQAKEKMSEFAPELMRQKGIENQRLAAGRGVLPSLQNLEQTQTNLIQTVAKFSGAIEVATKAMMDITEYLPSLAKAVVDSYDTLSGGGVSSPSSE
jgi:hypothetical protein